MGKNSAYIRSNLLLMRTHLQVEFTLTLSPATFQHLLQSETEENEFRGYDLAR